MAGPEAAISLNVAMFRETRGALASFSSAHRAVLCWPRRPSHNFRTPDLYPYVFRGKFLGLLKQDLDQGKVQEASQGLKALRKKKWVVYAKKPFGSPQTILDYLGRYTHRVALSNDRILKVKNGQVTFSYRDRRDTDRKKTMTLDAQEFIRRFLLHVLPEGFTRIRHFGFLANRAKKHSLPQCRKLLGLNPALPKLPKRSAQDLLLKLTGIDLTRCPACKQGTMVIVAELLKLRLWNSS